MNNRQDDKHVTDITERYCDNIHDRNQHSLDSDSKRNTNKYGSNNLLS